MSCNTLWTPSIQTATQNATVELFDKTKSFTLSFTWIKPNEQLAETKITTNWFKIWSEMVDCGCQKTSIGKWAKLSQKEELVWGPIISHFVTSLLQFFKQMSDDISEQTLVGKLHWCRQILLDLAQLETFNSWTKQTIESSIGLPNGRFWCFLGLWR